MKRSSRITEFIVLGVFIGGLGFAFFGIFGGSNKAVSIDVQVPELSALAMQGREAFDANCAKCHGKNAAGSGNGPPLVHNLYNPGHHSDAAIVSAARRGVRQHHWPYGNMKPLPQVTDAELAAIIKYIRELQAANGIVTKPHNM